MSTNRVHSGCRGFTLIELLVVIAIIAVLASLILPAIAKAKLKAQGIYCLNNHKGLTLAWTMYAGENNDTFPLATCIDTNSPERPSAWMTGFLNFKPGNHSNWDLNEDIYKSPLYRHASAPGIFKCPADRSVVNVPGKGWLPRVRSMSMNQHVGGVEAGATPNWLVGLRFYKRSSDLDDPGPSGTWLFIDEREDAANYPGFEVVMAGWKPYNPALYTFTDWPASYHHRAGGLSFTDGHSEIRRWRDDRTMPQVSSFRAKAPGDQDIRWLQERTTRPIN